MNPVFFFNDRVKGIAVSLAFHAAVLAAGFAFMKPVEYAVELGSGGVELSLVAAPAEKASASSALAENAAAVLKKKPAAQRPADPAEKKGDGSSPVSGRDATTFYSPGGAVAETAPDYLKNPAPAYPLEARRKGWEGVVVLRVLVDESGRAARIETEKSSGRAILDEAASDAIRKWRFRPARFGGRPVESSVFIPVRFKLEK